MPAIIRAITPNDIERVLDLLREFAEFEKLSEYCTATAERFDAALFGSGVYVSGLVAEDAGEIVAYMLYYPNFSSFRGERGLYLEDVYITPSHQRRGLGRLLLAELAREALRRGFERIDFQVLDWNTNAIDFYRSLGAVSNDDETHFKFPLDPIRLLANS